MEKRLFPNRLVLVFALAATFVLIGGAWFYQAQEKRLERRATAELTAVARLKVDEIVRWRGEEIARARLVSEDPFFIAAATEVLGKPAPRTRKSMLIQFQNLKAHLGYHDIILVGPDGAVHLRLGEGPARISREMLAGVAEALRRGTPVLTDLHTGVADSIPHVDVVAPLAKREGTGSKTLGALIFRVDAQTFLYAMLRTWPAPSESSETLLVRRDGNDVLFLNDLRHRKDTALKLRISLNQTDVPAVMAVLGREGLVKGRDYRGVPVLSAFKAIPDSPWFMVAKVDETEIMSRWRFEAALILAVVLAILIALSAAVASFWQRKEKRHYRDLARAEAARTEAEERYRTTLLSIGDGVIATDADGRVAMLNPVAEALTGRTLDEARGRPIEEVFPILNEETRAAVENPVRRVLREGFVVGLANHTVLVARDGSERPIADSGAPIREADGHIHGVVLVFRDQTAEREGESALRKSEERFRRIFHANPDSLCINRLEDGLYEDINEGFTAMTGYTAEEVIGKTSEDIKIWHHPADRLELIRCLSEKGYCKGLETEFRCKDGSTKAASVSAAVILFQDVPHLISITHDLTEIRRAEEERREMEVRVQRAEKMEALGMLAGGVAHDLNNVLGILVGYSELLLCEIEPESPLRNHVENIMNAGERAAAIIQDLLALARRGVQAKKVVNLNAIVSAWLRTPEFMKLASLHPRVRLVTDLAPDLLHTPGSEVHLGKVLANLVFNAAEAMPDGGRLSVTTGNRYLDRPVRGYDDVHPGDYVILTVSDTGGGIAPADLHRIFEPFYTRKVMGRSGTGLGLAVVWGAVKDHDGYIDVESAEGKGTSFTVYLPVTREEMERNVPVPVSDYMGRGETVLVVDDVAEQRELAAVMLTKLNYRVETAAGGEEAVRYLREKSVDLVLLDMIMDPGMDGLETYQGIVEIRPGQKAVIVSGFAETDRVRMAQELGAGPYVRKPYILERLGQAVRRELDRR